MDYSGYSYEIELIEQLQNSFAKHESTMMYLSQLSDPRNSFLFFFPIVYSLSRVVGLKVLWAAVISEWVNVILKWCLFGQRPYWWVQETDVYANGGRPNLKQFELTCETGPGNPSGHCLVTMAVWFIMMSALSADLEKTALKQPAKKPANLKEEREADKKVVSPAIPWGLLAALAVLVCISRVFIATHFPHQTLIGVVIGVIVGIAVDRMDVTKVGLKTYITVTIFLASAVVGQCLLMQQLGVDPNWTLQLAAKWCARQEWVHLDTTAFFSIARDLGALFFVGLMQYLPIRPKGVLSSLPMFLTMVSSVVLSQVLEKIPLQVDNITLFYILGGLKYGLILSCVVLINSLFSYVFVKDKTD
ncbi:glucose-6-phosphatase-like [Anneissia japonica]|uniref:glucose-6-phosphatase-like n=1 Tax=Anneissia japonica TaxID=1529436 RepID=UPI001425BB31|nr:glucose-6-phosphatase-like [Anneissia japonica]